MNIGHLKKVLQCSGRKIKKESGNGLQNGAQVLMTHSVRMSQEICKWVSEEKPNGERLAKISGERLQDHWSSGSVSCSDSVSRSDIETVKDYADSLPRVGPSAKPFEQLLEEANGKKKILGEKLKEIENEAEICKKCKRDCQTIERDYQPRIVAEVEVRNGTDQTVIQMARTLIQNAKNIVENQTDKFQMLIKELEQFLTTVLYKNLQDLISLIETEVKYWQHELQLRYAELFADVDLDSFAPCCAETGSLLRDVLSTDIPRLENAVNAADVQVDVNLTLLGAKFSSLLSFLYQRILGADTLETLGGVQIHACFVNEGCIDNYYDAKTGILNVGGLEKEGSKIEREKTSKFVRQRNTAVYEAAISPAVCINLKRAKDKRVFQEKYRLVFTTEFNNEKYWTLSLPMVVTTGGIQLCECLASIMWQCFSTDVFALPTEPLPVLPWSRVADMLQAKIRNISTHKRTRKLTEDNLAHLRERLLSTTGATDDTEINLTQFCIASLPDSVDNKNEEFSFWKWFLSIYNLIKKHLQDIWEKGWIEGFLSKETTERKLNSHHKQMPGLFLLRFSDTSLDSTQTKDAVFGQVATSLLAKDKSEPRSVTVTHVDRFGHDLLSKNKLLHILSMTKNNRGTNIYKYLYPKMETCEQLLEGNTIPAPVVIGYLGVRNAFIADLDEIDDQLSKLALGTNATTCASSSMETDIASDDDEQTVSEAKKLKTSLNNSTIMELKDKSNDACESSVVTDEIHGLTELVTPRGAKGSPVLRGLLTEKQSNCLPTAIQGCNSEDSVLLTETVPGSVATVTLSGDTFRNTVSQHQAQLAQGSYGFKAGTQQNDSNLSSLPVIANNLNVISEDKQKPVSFETVDMVPSLQNPSQCDTISQSDKADILDCLPYAGIDDTSNPVPNLRTSENVTAESKTSSCMREDAGQSDAVPDMATGNQQMYGTPGIGANNSVNNQNLTRFPYTHQNATNNSNHESQLNFDTAILTLKEPKTNNSRQMNNDKEAANQELASETPNQMLHQETSSNQTFGAGNLSLLDMDTDNSLSGFWKDEFEDILNQTIKTRDVQTQTEPYPESMNAMSERWEGQKSQMECLTLLLKRLPNDQKQRVIQALQGDTNESQF